ncbi:MAG: ribonuclease HI family protein [Bacteroidota bacterium]
MKLIAYTDGAARGNPGNAGIGIVVKDEQGKTIHRIKQYIGNTTNNIAEYTALITLLEFLKQSETLRCTELVVKTDSELMARQISGIYKVKDVDLKLLFQKVKLLLHAAPYRFTIEHIPRALNHEADHLANEAIDNHEMPRK